MNTQSLLRMPARYVGLCILVALALLLAGCAEESTSAAAQSDAAEPAAAESDNIVSATGEVRPAKWAALSFQVDGQVAAVLVEEGQAVAAGEPLAQLDAVRLERAVAEAGAALGAAEADLARLQAGAHERDLAAARETVAAAAAAVRGAEAQVTLAEVDVTRAEAGHTAAEAQVAVADAAVKVAQAQLASAGAEARPEALRAARAALDKAAAAVRQAQTSYDRAGRAGDAPEGLLLEQATLDLQIAQAGYDQLAAGARPSDLAPLRAAVQAAQAELALVRAQAAAADGPVAAAATGVTAAEAALDAARAHQAGAQAALDRLAAGATAEELAIAQAAVDCAREALGTAEALLAQATLVAPFDGTVALVQIRPGESVLPGQTALMLGDLAGLRVETTDLDEIDIARVVLGQPVDLTFDALPDKVLRGHVERIAPMATPGQGATTYTAIITLDEGDPALRWGMTAFADIEVE